MALVKERPGVLHWLECGHNRSVLYCAPDVHQSSTVQLYTAQYTSPMSVTFEGSQTLSDPGLEVEKVPV